MNQQELLEETLSGLEKLISRYKTNSTPGDRERLKATQEAHSALRKVILMIALNGDFNVISPTKKGNKHGWMVIDKNNKTRYYC